MAAQTNSGFSKTVLDYIDKKDEAQLKPLLFAKSSEEYIKNEAWDLVPKLCDFFTDKIEKTDSKKVTLSMLTLERITRVANPKETLLVLLEQADQFKDDIKFKALLMPIQICLRSLPGKRGHSLGITLETLYGHIESLPLPQEFDLEGGERLLMEMDDNVTRINNVLADLLDFLEPLAVDISFRNPKADQKEGKAKESREMIRFLLRLLFHPVAYLDVGYLNAEQSMVETTARLHAIKLITLLTAVRGDHHKTLIDALEEIDARARKQRKAKVDGQDEEDLDLEHPISQLSLSVLSYLVFGEGIGIEYVPTVLSPQYLLEFNVQFIEFLLTRTEATIQFKGITLLKTRVELVPDQSLDANILEWEKFQEVLEAVVNVMIICRVKEIRQLALSVIPDLFQKFEMKAKNRFIYFMLNRTKHAGLAGYMIKMLKEEIDTNLKSHSPSIYFIGSELERVLNCVFGLPGGAETDLLEQNERIMAALNLLRFLVIRDPKANNRTGIWNLLPNIQKSYCDTLRTAINLSRAHYKLEEEKTRKGEYLQVAGEPGMTLSVGGQEMPPLSMNEQLNVLTLASHTFDLMDSVLGRVSELISQHQQETVA